MPQLWESDPGWEIPEFPFKWTYSNVFTYVVYWLYSNFALCLWQKTIKRDIYLTRSLGFLKLLGQKLQQLANLGSVSSSTALSLISLIRSLSAADWARIRSDTEASSPGSFASSAACSSVKVMISKPLLFDVFWSPSSSSSSSSSSTSWLSRPITVRIGICRHHSSLGYTSLLGSSDWGEDVCKQKHFQLE